MLTEMITVANEEQLNGIREPADLIPLRFYWYRLSFSLETEPETLKKGYVDLHCAEKDQIPSEFLKQQFTPLQAWLC